MNNGKLPWQLVPELKEEHLIKVAQRLAQVRDDVVDLHDPDGVKDTIKSLGFRVYECTRSTLIHDSQQPEFSFLKIVKPDGRFTFSINGFPVRFYRGDAEDDVEARRLITDPDAAAQYDMFGYEVQFEPVIWFFVIETKYDYYTQRIFLNGYKQFSGECVCSWAIPIKQTQSAPIVPINKPAEPVKLHTPAALITSKRNKPKSEQEENDSSN